MKQEYTVNTPAVVATCIAMLLALVLSSTAYAGWGWGRHHHDDDVVERVSSELELNTEQEGLLKDVVSTAFESMKERRDSRKELRAQQEESDKAFWQKENLLVEDIENYLESRQQANNAVMKQLYKPVLEKAVTFHASLNEEQREALAELIAESGILSRMHRGRHGHGKRGHY